MESLITVLKTYLDLTNKINEIQTFTGFFLIPSCFAYISGIKEGGAVAQSVERATPGQEVPGSIPAVAARSLLVGSVSV